MCSTYWFSVLLILVSNTLYFSDADPEFDPLKIVGGNATDPNDYKYAVGINCNKHLCGCSGSIIHELFVVSAAHCFFDILHRPSRILAGTNNISDYEQPGRVERDVVAIYIPAGYNLTSSYADDIAVLKLNESLQLKKNNLQKLRLPARPKRSTYTVSRAVLLGFGSTNITFDVNADGSLTENPQPNSVLYSANVQIVPLSKCYKHFVTTSNICARVIKDKSSVRHGSCNGDSGGPLVYKSQVLLGILINSPFGCNVRFDYAIYTSVKYYVRFIENAIKNNVTGMIVKEYH